MEEGMKMTSHYWLAWYPVRLNKGPWVWLQDVWAVPTKRQEWDGTRYLTTVDWTYYAHAGAAQ